jgi:hypothetical protein
MGYPRHDLPPSQIDQGVSRSFGLLAEGSMESGAMRQQQHQPFQAPRVQPLCQDRLEWTSEQLRFAAAVLGDQGAALLRTTLRCVEDEDVMDSIYYRNQEAFRIARHLAMEAWHYATRAEALDVLHDGTIGQVVR